MNDINNESKKIEERYKNLSVELETILDIIPGMVFCKNKNDVVTRVNQTFADLLKLNKEDIIGKTSFDLFPPEQAEKFRKDDLGVMTSKKPKLNIEESADFPEGKIFSITNKVPYFDKKGEVIGTIGLAIDITDRKVMEQNLKESEEKYRSVIDALTRIGIGIDIIDLNFKILYQNKVLKDIFGQSEGKLCYKTYLGLDEQCDFCPMIKAVRNNKTESAIIPIPDGKIYEVISAPLPNLDGIIDRAAEVVIDITERKQAEIKLKKEREKAELYLNLVNVIIVALDRDGIITLINKKGCEILEYREEELIGQNWFETCLPPQDRNRVLTYFKKLMDGEIDVIESYENPIWTKHRNERLIAWSTVLFKDNSGKITGLLSSGEDITERKIAEEALLKEKKFTEKALNTQRDTFFVFEPSTGKAIRWNNAFSEITGYTDEEILSMKAPASYYSEEDLKKASESIAKIEKEGIATVEINLITKNGKSIPFEYIGSSITDEEGNLKYIVALGRDITERRKAEQDLKESENKYRQISERYEMLLESITDAVYVINRDWVYTLVNKMAEKIVHMPIENLLGNKITEVFPGIEHTSFFKTYDTVMNTRKPERVRDAFILPDGQTGYYEVSVYPINEGILCIGRNVTEEIKAEQKIKQEREKIELYLNLVSVIIVTLDRDGIITLINKKGCEILGYSKEALIGKNWFETCLPPQIRNRASKNFKKLMDGEIDELRSYENLIWTKYGDEKLIAWSTVILKDKSGNITGTLGSGEDITERKKAEIILKESEKKYKYLANELEMILDHIPGLVFFKDTENNFIRLNKYHADAHNLRKEDMEGVNCFDIYPKEQAQAYWEDDLEVIRTKKPKFNIIEPWDTPEGTRWALTSKIPYFDENGKITGIVGFAADITERKKTEEKLIVSETKYRDAYEQAEFYKDLFAHDISNILQNIQASLGLLSMWRNQSEKTEKVKEIMNILNDQVVRGSKLVSNIRKLSQISETESKLEFIEIIQILKDAVKFIHKSYPEKDLSIHIDSPIEKIFIQANELLLDLFENILINAIKYNVNPKIEILIKFSKQIKNETKFIKIEFIDNGVGVPDAMKERIFGGIAPRKDKVHGMGLGLLLVKRIINNFNGQIWVEDKIKGDPSQGSNFILLIPEVV